ncbi:MAG: LysE family translocator [Pseudomonadota bacterium]
MTITLPQLALYMGALFILFATPGPVWVAVAARAVSSGAKSTLPLALGVALGDLLWPLVAVFGVTAIVAVWADFLIVLRYAGALVLIVMGLALIRHADKNLAEASGLSARGAWASFMAGFLAVTANPKASLFYMALLPTFFDFTSITALDVAAICVASFVVPLVGNMVLALCVGRLRRLLSSPKAVRRTNVAAGSGLIGVGGVIAAT